MSQVLVTGAAGFIGSHLVDRLLGEGCAVEAVDSFDAFYDTAMKRANTAAHRRSPGYRLVVADIRNADELRARLSGHYDAIVHLAGRNGVRASIADPVGFHEVNVCGTRNLLEMAREWGVEQFVFASSSSVYGVNPDVPWREDASVPRPISPVAETKVACELMGHVYAHLYGVRFLAMRLFTVYGPRQRPDLAIHKFARLMLQGEPVPIYGDGSTQRDYTYVGDIVRGLRAAMEYRDTVFEIFNLGNDRTVGLAEMVRSLEELLGVTARLQYGPPQPGDLPRTWADISKAKRRLGYVPRTGFRQGLQRFVDWLASEQTDPPAPVHGMPVAYGEAPR